LAAISSSSQPMPASPLCILPRLDGFLACMAHPILIGLLVLLIVLYPFQGWITWLVHRRRREGKFTVTAPRHRPRPAEWRDDRVTVSWLGHSTLLVNFLGKTVLTDPVFGDSVGIHLPGRIS